MAQRLHGLAAVLCLLGAAVAWLRQALLPWLQQLRPLVLEPEGFLERLAAVKKRSLSASELEAFDRDGVLVVPGVLTDRFLLRELRLMLRQHQNMASIKYRKTWLYNGAVRSVIRAGLMTELIAAALKGPCTLQEAPIWGSDGCREFNSGLPDHHIGAWHADLPGEQVNITETVTAWLAVTDAPHGLEFIRGTMGRKARIDIFRECNRSQRAGSPGERLLDSDCVRRYAKEKLEPELRQRSQIFMDLKAGDLVLFHGNLVHRGIQWLRPRLALSVRLSRRRLADGRYDIGHTLSYQCHQEGATFFPPGAPGFRGRDPLACVSEELVARPDGVIERSAPVRLLPPEKNLGAAARLLRRVVAGVEGVFLSV